MKQFNNKNKSFTLIEVIVAIFFLTAGIFGAYTVIQQTIIITSVSASKLTAAYLSQEGIEIVRNIRDTNWLEDRSVDTDWNDGLVIPTIDCSAGCEADYKTNTPQEDTPLRLYNGGSYLNIDSNGFYSYSLGLPTKFKRKITITPDGTDILKVSVEVSWQEGTALQDITVQENLYNWR